MFLVDDSLVNDYFFNQFFMTRQEYFNTLLELFTEYIEATREDVEEDIKEEILAFIDENEVDNN